MLPSLTRRAASRSFWAKVANPRRLPASARWRMTASCCAGERSRYSGWLSRRATSGPPRNWPRARGLGDDRPRARLRGLVEKVARREADSGRGALIRAGVRDRGQAEEVGGRMGDVIGFGTGRRVARREAGELAPKGQGGRRGAPEALEGAAAAPVPLDRFLGERLSRGPLPRGGGG